MMEIMKEGLKDNEGQIKEGLIGVFLECQN